MANRYWVGGTGTWNATNTANWSTATGGAGGASVPTSADIVYIDAGSGSPTVTVAAGYNPSVNTFYFTANNSTFNLNNNTLTCAFFNTSNGTGVARVFAFGATGQVTITGNNGNVLQIRLETGLSFTGSAKFVLTYTGSVGTRTLQCPAFSAPCIPNVFITGGSDIIAFNGSSGGVTGELNFTGFSGRVTPNQMFVWGNYIMSPTQTVNGSPVGSLYMQQASGNCLFTTSGAPLLNTSVVKALSSSNQGATLIFTDANVTLPILTLNSGTLDFATYNSNVTVTKFTAPGVSPNFGRAIKWGTGTFTITGTNDTVLDMNTLGPTSFINTPPVIRLTGNGAAGTTRTLALGSTSGGALAKSLSFNVIAGADTIAVNGYYKDFTFQPAFTGNLGVTSSSAHSFYGNLTLHSAMAVTNSQYAVTMAPQTGNTFLTTSNIPFNCPLTISAATGANTVLNDNVIMPSSANGVFTFNTGGFDGNAKTINAWSFISSGSLLRYFNQNGANINLSGSNTSVVSIATTNLSTVGNTVFNLTYAGADGNRAISSPFTSQTNSISFNVLGGTDNVAVTGANNLNFSGFSGNFYLTGNSTIFGNMILPAGMNTGESGANTLILASSDDQSIQTNNTIIRFPTMYSGAANVVLVDNLTIANTFTQNAGNVLLNNNQLAANTVSIGASAKSINWGNTGVVVLTADSGNLWSAPNVAGWSAAGTVSVVSNTVSGANRSFYSGTTGANITQFNSVPITITSGSDVLSFNGGFRGIDFGAWSNGTFTQSIANGVVLYGNTYIPANTSVTGNNIKLYGNSLTYTFDTGNNVIDTGIITVLAANSNITIANNLITVSDRLALSSGNVTVVGNVTVDSVAAAAGVTGGLVMGNGTWSLTGSSKTVWQNGSLPANYPITAGNSTVVLANDTAGYRTMNFATGTVLNNVVIGGNTVNSVASLVGNVTFNTLSGTNLNPWTLLLNPDDTYTMTNWTISGSAGNPVTLGSIAPKGGGNTAHNLVLVGGGTINTVDWLNISNSNASPGSTWYAGNNSIDLGGVTGWIFPSAGGSNFFLVF